MRVSGDEGRVVDLESIGLRPLHIAVVVVCSLGFFFDLAEMSLSSILSTVFSAPPQPASPTQLAWLLAAPYVGGIVGAPLMGWCADRWGRKRVLCGILFWLGIVSIPAASANSIEALIAFRALCGISMGAYPPIMIAYLTDMLPAKHRGLLLLLCCTVGTLGATASSFLLRWLTEIAPLGVAGWRWGFLIYGVAAIIIGIAALGLPEPVRWLLKTGQIDRARVAFSNLIGKLAEPGLLPELPPETKASEAQSPTRIQQLVLAALTFLSPWATTALPTMSGAILMQKGMQLPDALLYVAIASFGPFFGSLVVAPISDRVGRKPLMWISAALILVGGAGFVLSDDMVPIIGFGLVLNTALAIYMTIGAIYNSELFPTRLRGRASASLWAVNRFGALTAPLVLMPLLRSEGVYWPVGIVICSILISMLLLFAAPKGRAGQVMN